MKIMFLDESGDHSLDKIDSSYPMFVLAGCIFEKDYYQQTIVPSFGKFKEKFFGSADIILHTAEMIRPLKYKEKIEELRIIGKSKNEAGLQIADLIASPIGRKILGIKTKQGNEVDFSVIEKKFLKDSGDKPCCGLNVFP